MPKILFASERVNDGASPEEQQRFEECVREEMKDAGPERSHTHRQHHDR